MKKSSLMLCASLLFLACNNSPDHHNATHTGSEMEMSAADPEQPQNPNAKTDPVCGMVEEDLPYTDFSVQNQDTTWFCSPHCKEQFDKDPAKFARK